MADARLRGGGGVGAMQATMIDDLRLIPGDPGRAFRASRGEAGALDMTRAAAGKRTPEAGTAREGKK